MKIIIRQPETDTEWQQYYELRWRVLREPWQQARGSEKDELESDAFHRAAFADDNIIGVSRLHRSGEQSAQIRYMAVDLNHQGYGVGNLLLDAMEKIAKDLNTDLIELNARENAIGFYLQAGYKNIRPAHTLYQCIPHVFMQKTIS